MGDVCMGCCVVEKPMPAVGNHVTSDGASRSELVSETQIRT